MITDNILNTGADRTEDSPVEDREAGGSSPRVRRAEQFSRFGLELTRADGLIKVGELLRDFCDELWDWDSFLFSVRRGRSSHYFNTVLIIDTIDGERTDCPPQDYCHGDFSGSWDRLLEGEPVLINRPAQEEISPKSTFGDADRLSASLVFVPITLGDQVAGVISLQSYTLNAFDVNDQELLLQIAEIVAPTLLRCRAEERMQEFLRLGERLNQVVDTGGVTRVVANTAANLVGWEYLSLHLCDEDCGRLSLVLGLQRSGTEYYVTTGDVPYVVPENSILFEALRGSAIAADLTSISEDDKQRLLPFGGPLPLLSSIIMAPIRSMNRVMGLLCLQSKSRVAYGSDETEIVRGLADYCSGALERAWAQQNLAESEENYRLLVENVNDGIVISQNDFFIFFNDRFSAMLGYEPNELRSKRYTDIYTEAGLEVLRQRAASRDAGIAPSDRYETLFRTKSGEQLPVEASVRIIHDYRGREATFAIVRDISERQEAEVRIHQSEKELRTLVEAMTDIILVLDQDGVYQDHNSAGEPLAYTAGEKLAGKSVHEVFSHEKANYFIKLFRRSLKNRETLNVEYDLVNSAGIQHWYNASISPHSDNTVLMVARDITERRLADEELFRSNARYKALLDGSEDYIFVLDRNLRFVHVNSVIEKRFGISPEERIGKSVYDIYGSKPPPEFVQLIRQVFETGKPITYDDDSEINGKIICTETVISPVFDMAGKVEAVLGISRDVTSRRQAALALQQSERRYAVAVRGANDGIWDWNLEADRIYLSPRWWAIVGEPEPQESEFKPAEWLDRLHPGDVTALREKIQDHIDGGTPHLEDEHRIRHSNGTYRWVLCRGICVRDENGNAIRMAGSISDITARKSAEEQLQFGASHDTLTNLPNRAYFLSCLNKTIARARRRSSEPEQFAVLFLDLDRFKVINDSLGHLAGDELIITTARRLEKCVRPGDLVARLGGDEFTVLLEDLAHGEDATRIAQRIIEELSEPINISGFPVQTTVSIGITFDRPEYQKPEDLLRDADTAMYKAKATGRNRYQVFDQKMHDRVMEQLHLEGDLRKAVAGQEFVMHYQPVYELATKRLCGFEALIRWNHPEQGLIPPNSFISIAEENGLIVTLGRWVLEDVARASAALNADRPANDQLSFSINMSPRQFSQGDLVSHVHTLLSDAGAPLDSIIFEITENCLLDESHQMGNILQGLREIGIRLDLDDFGTGHSSLSFLRRFPLDMLKIDKSFVKDLGQNAQSREIVSAILALARGLGLRVTAEGVETEAQFNALVEMKCDWAQGYYLGKPVPLEEAVQLLRHGTSSPAEPGIE